MKVSRFQKPYKSTGRTTFPEMINKSGVYLIRENSRLVYVGMSQTNLYRTMYRHFETWNHSGQGVITYAGKMKKNDYTVRVILCTKAQAARLEKALIKKHRPRDNENKYKSYELVLEDTKVFTDYTNTEIVPF
jgi:excinuclease UvrABC nuclease subunit